MKIDNLRASTIGAYRDCEWKFFLEYVIGFQGFSGKKAELGTCSHKIGELLAIIKIQNRHTRVSKFNDYKYLTEVCFNRMVKEKGHLFKFEPKDKRFVLEQVEAIVNSRFDPFKCNILHIERQFEIDLNLPGFKLDNDKYLKLRGTIDRIDEISPDTIEIIDYKTGERKDWLSGKPKELEGFIKDLQFRIYNIASSRIYSKYKYRIFTIIYTRDGGPFSISFEEDEILRSLDTIRRIFKQIKTNESPKRLKDDRSRSREFFKCKYVCHFGKTKTEDGRTLCDHYHKILKENEFNKATDILYQIKLDQSLTQKASPRNDYSGSKIFKANLHEETK